MADSLPLYDYNSIGKVLTSSDSYLYHIKVVIDNVGVTLQPIIGWTIDKGE